MIVKLVEIIETFNGESKRTNKVFKSFYKAREFYLNFIKNKTTIKYDGMLRIWGGASYEITLISLEAEGGETNKEIIENYYSDDCSYGVFTDLKIKFGKGF